MCQSPADPHWETDALSDDQQLAMRGGLRGRLAEEFCVLQCELDALVHCVERDGALTARATVLSLLDKMTSRIQRLERLSDHAADLALGQAVSQGELGQGDAGGRVLADQAVAVGTVESLEFGDVQVGATERPAQLARVAHADGRPQGGQGLGRQRRSRFDGFHRGASVSLGYLHDNAQVVRCLDNFQTNVRLFSTHRVPGRRQTTGMGSGTKSSRTGPEYREKCGLGCGRGQGSTPAFWPWRAVCTAQGARLGRSGSKKTRAGSGHKSQTYAG